MSGSNPGETSCGTLILRGASRDALNGAFSESSTNTLQSPLRREQAYFRVLQYLYTGHYDDDRSDSIENDGTAFGATLRRP